MTFQSFFSFGACLENDSMWSVPLCVYIYIYLKVFFVLLYFLFSFAGQESKGNLYTTVNTVQFRKNIWVFFKRKPKLTLTLLQNVCMSLLLLKINELVRWRRVSREVCKFQEWPVLLLIC